MSYCRWSSDNFNCDIYAYESDQGFVIHTAGRRYTDEERTQEKMVDIDLPLTGETFVLEDLTDFKDKLLELRGIGYRFPDYVLKAIDEEINEKSEEA